MINGVLLVIAAVLFAVVYLFGKMGVLWLWIAGFYLVAGIANLIFHVIREKRKYSDFAILYRTNAQARVLEERMVVEGIPYRVVGGINFYARQEIKDILAYLKTIDNGRDDVAVKRILNIPKRGIGPTTVEKVDDYAEMRDISFYDALRDADNIMSLGRSGQKIDGFVTLIQAFRAKAQEYSIADLIRDILEKIGYIEYLKFAPYNHT